MRKSRAPKKAAAAPKTQSTKRLPMLQPGTAKKIERLLREITALLYATALKSVPSAAAKPAAKAVRGRPKKVAVKKREAAPAKKRKSVRAAKNVRQRNKDAAKDASQAMPNTGGATPPLEIAHG